MTAAEIAAIRHGLSVTLHGRAAYAPRTRGRFALRLEWDLHFGVGRPDGVPRSVPRSVSVEVFRYGRRWRILRDGRMVEYGTFGAEPDTAPLVALLQRMAGDLRGGG